jgi:type IV secretion system protein VirB9
LIHGISPPDYSRLFLIFIEKKEYRMNRILPLALISILALSPMAQANQLPRGLATDYRIKVINYNPDDIVTLRGSHLINTTIQFGKTEIINGITVGDALAWSTSFNKATPNLLNIKPVLPTSDTNMTVTTNRHLYQFRLVTTAKDTPQSSNVTYSIRFTYPDEEKAITEGVLKGLQQTLVGDASTNPVKWNDNYAFIGSKAIAPIKALDNGIFTVFEFRDHRTIPAIFTVDSARNEALVNFRVQGNYVFIQATAHQFTLRNGKDVTTVYNEAFIAE